MQLYSSSPSPFGRKVKITAYVAGLYEQLEVVTIDGNDPESTQINPNPLNKIPALALESGELIVDSKVICEYLIQASGRTEMLPEDHRIEYLTRAAIADGITEAALLMVYERRFREPTQMNTAWLHRQNQKVLSGLRWWTEAIIPVRSVPTLDQIGLAVALGYLDFRFSGEWRTQFANLALWSTQFQKMVPAYQLTDPQA